NIILFFSSRRRHTIFSRDWSSDVCSSDLYYAHESCGQCTPCREGTPWMYKILKKINSGEGRMDDIDLLWDVQRKIEGNTICPLGDAAAWPVAAAIRHFRDEFEWHINNPELAQTQNFGLARYADPIPVPAANV